MGRLRRAILILGLAFVAFGFAVPRSDVPGTPFDERDTPVNQITSVIPRGELAPPTRLSVIVPQPLWFEYEIRTIYVRTAPEPRVQVGTHFLLSLLCTFVC